MKFYNPKGKLIDLSFNINKDFNTFVLSKNRMGMSYANNKIIFSEKQSKK